MAALSFCTQIHSPPPLISTSISNQPYLTMLENHCKTMKDLQKIHTHLIKTGLINNSTLSSRVLAFCSSPQTGDINYAYTLFTRIQNPNLFSWNTIIRAFSNSANPQLAISLFIDMLINSSVEPIRLTYPSVFKAFAHLGLAYNGAQLHGRVIKLGIQSDEFVRNTIIFMYCSCYGFLSDARKVFDEMCDFDLVAWNIMIMGLAKFGEIDESRKVFDQMGFRNTISWNSMISGYVRNGRFKEALELFSDMQEEKNIRPSEYTMVSLLNACGRLGAIRQGEWIHAFLKMNKFELNSIVVTAIIDMYCKCGCPSKAFHVFDSVSKNGLGLGLSCWNSMIFGLATNGHEIDAIDLFSELERSSSLEPDDISFIAVLTACSHSGMVEKAKGYFRLMTDKYKIEPCIKHYSCMVDVLGRAGVVEEAEEVIRTMPIKPDVVIWGSLLSACRNHGNVDLAKRAAKEIIKLDENESSSYVLMSNMYAGSGQFEDTIEERRLMKEKNVEKEPGCSLIEVNGEVHEFVAGGRLHPENAEIYRLLNEFGLQLQ